MKIELKNITHNSRLSEETYAYKANLYVDGNKIGEVGNEGHGGPDSFHGDWEAFRKADDWCRENLPKWDMSQYGDEPHYNEKHDTTLEMYCNELVTEFLQKKHLRSMLNRAVVMIEGADVYTLPFKRNPKDKYPQNVILNDMPFPEAFSKFQATAQ